MRINATELLVLTEEWRPYNYTNEQGLIVGRATKKVREVLAIAEVDYEIKSYPWIRAMETTKTRPNTMLYTIYRTASREDDFEWACPLIRPVPMYFFKLKTRNDIQVATLEEAKNYTSAVVKGNLYHEFLIEHGFIPGQHLIVSAQPDSFYKPFFKGRIDLVMSTEYLMSEALEEAGMQYDDVELLIEVTKANQQRGCIAFNKETAPVIIDSVKRALAQHNKAFVGP
ncbi:substrate-binding periplasmic protein [Pseudoalteromonas piscicida]|uniref:ABC transporter substrate-binding protein n=1 Tax=Pseudoalteromonas piscicida TaxID=43662 RepID=A0A2A5JUH0_PSEO7|nr:transporter substrate-binding domain-containing protein [Pseudoalteromonas piscicida]PCK32997.1 ABC transporter substrate-binding protein [Pseudoalteromonas piscicida]